MDAVTLARFQFAMTIGFHYIFPPLTIGLSWLIFWFMNRYMRSGEAIYLRHVRFWLKLFAITFAVGVATGITMEFQFGTNWADYARYVGDIFGAPLAAEGLLAFFLESTFMGVLLFGWGRLSKRTMWFSSLMVALGATLSAFWIIVANSWMQTPAGYEIVNGRAQLTDFWAAVFNPSLLERYSHTIIGCLVTGAFFMLGVSAWYLLKKEHVEFAKRSLKTALVLAFASSVMQLVTGHHHGVQVANTQPEKLAAFEGLFETQDHAPALFFGIPDVEEGKVHAAFGVPSALSIMVGWSPDTVVKGLNDFPREEWPPVLPTFFSFHLMAGLGAFFIALSAYGLLLLWQGKLYENRLFLKLALLSIPLPIIANQLGWIVAEVGRQPWIVYRLLKTADAISQVVPAWQVLLSIIVFAIVYTVLFVAWLYVLRREIKKGPAEVEEATS
jgi:cytochrome d ubiquinol oxidase subunit I